MLTDDGAYRLLILKHFLVWLLIVVPLKLLGKAVLLLVLPFVGRSSETLPKFIRWFDNAQYYRGMVPFDGLAGDYAYRVRTNYFSAGYFKRIWLRYTWLARRNSINYFQTFKLGKVWTGAFRILHESGDPEVGDTRKPGLRKILVEDAGSDEFLWEWYLVKIWPKLYWNSKRRCVRIRLGYKVAQLTTNNIPWENVQWVFSISPLHGYTGEEK